MRLTLGDLPAVEYHWYEIPVSGLIHCHVLTQTRISTELEIMVVFTCDAGGEHILEGIYERAPGTIHSITKNPSQSREMDALAAIEWMTPLSLGPTGDPLERIVQGWSRWPGDARAAVQTQTVMFRAFLPASVRTAHLALSHLVTPHLLEVEHLRGLSSEEVRFGSSFGYAQVGELMIGRVSRYPSSSDPQSALRLSTQPEDWGVQHESFNDRIDARFVTRSDIQAVRQYPVELSS